MNRFEFSNEPPNYEGMSSRFIDSFSRNMPIRRVKPQIQKSSQSGGGGCTGNKQFYLELTNGMLKLLDTIKTYSSDRSGGSFLLRAEVALITVKTKWEYMVQMDLFGPPRLGKFDENILQRIRVEQGPIYNRYEYMD